MANAPIPYDLTGELDGDLANARLVSSRLAVQDVPAPNAVGATDMVWQWGRLLDHDLSLSAEAAHGEGVPIRMATGDPTFDPFRTGRRFIPFNRSAYDAATGTGLDNPREQVGHCPDQGQGPGIPKRAQAVTPGLQRRRLHAEFHRPRLRQHHRHHHSPAHWSRTSAAGAEPKHGWGRSFRPKTAVPASAGTRAQVPPPPSTNKKGPGGCRSDTQTRTGG